MRTRWRIDEDLATRQVSTRLSHLYIVDVGLGEVLIKVEGRDADNFSDKICIICECTIMRPLYRQMANVNCVRKRNCMERISAHRADRPPDTSIQLSCPSVGCLSSRTWHPHHRRRRTGSRWRRWRAASSPFGAIRGGSASSGPRPATLDSYSASLSYSSLRLHPSSCRPPSTEGPLATRRRGSIAFGRRRPAPAG